MWLNVATAHAIHIKRTRLNVTLHEENDALLTEESRRREND